jgi:tRNA (guanine37-N1)-methyltransferase
LAARLRKLLSTTMPPENLAHVYNSYDVVGDIAIIRLTKESYEHRPVIAQALMDSHKNVRTVLAQIGAVHGSFRLRTLEYIAGEKKTATLHRESGCSFQVDVEKCYFSPRLQGERMRVAKQPKDGEVIVNMFAGVGCFSILIAKQRNVEKVYSIDVNPVAVQYMQENIRVNGVFGRVIPIIGDAKTIIEKRLSHVADRVIMPLPEKALEYLPYAVLALRKGSGCIHYYDFEHAAKKENPVEKVKSRVAKKLGPEVTFEIPFSRVVRSTGPNWYQMVLDIHVRSKDNESTDN